MLLGPERAVPVVPARGLLSVPAVLCPPVWDEAPPVPGWP
jgi:hypothetical protein